MDDSNALGLSALAGGAWFLDKVLGPSAEALGESLRVYLASRVSTIFAKAEEITAQRSIVAKPVAPGLLTRMIIDASFSDEDPTITEWWANLFVDAATNGSNLHAVFSDVMAYLGPREVHCFHDFVNFRGTALRPTLRVGPPRLIGQSEAAFESLISPYLEGDIAGKYPETVSLILSAKPQWPMIATEWKLPRAVEGAESELTFGLDKWSRDRGLELSILQRAGLLVPVAANYSVWGGTIWVKGLSLTSLGFEFYCACTGEDIVEAK